MARLSVVLTVLEKGFGFVKPVPRGGGHVVSVTVQAIIHQRVNAGIVGGMESGYVVNVAEVEDYCAVRAEVMAIIKVFDHATTAIRRDGFSVTAI